jgi:hypothetical protein
MDEIVKQILAVNLLRITHVELTKLCRKLIVDHNGDSLSLRQAYIVASLLKELHKSLL